MKNGYQALSVVALVLLALPELCAQSTPGMGAFQFSDGVHATFDATFADTKEREVVSFWRNELKRISAKVTNKKELIGATARIPAASPDTMRIYIAVDKPKGALLTTAHIAFLTTAGFVGPDSPERELNGCTAWVQQRTVTLRKQIAQGILDKGQRDLDRLQRQLDMLKRDKDRAERNLGKARDRSERATKDKADLERQLGSLEGPVAEADSTADPDAEKERMKQQGRLRDKAERAGKTIEAMEKKAKDLQWAITQNGKDQVAKQAEVERQQEVVQGLREKLEAIH